MTILINADNFFNAYLVLQESNTVLTEKMSSTIEQTSGEKSIIGTLPTMGVEIVCLAFSIELYMKYLYSVIQEKSPRSHKIFDLFEKLPKQIKQRVFNCELISRNPFNTQGNLFSTERFNKSYSAYDGFIEQLKLISDGFVDWRYSYEKTALRYDISFALAFIESIKLVAQEERKRSNNMK